ncbi:ferrochelatase [Microbacterium sp. No. 7]|uniref:ferrochelatase n=1 Tax=Microbacterium sp. No. 7 TaxID=1714373 RepID=UPI0006D1519E|nr:ferrochelatase [Microbacterium sp. No. 7]ALJ19756.1 ferrochelatase [Microbacterium sp. No. 7]
MTALHDTGVAATGAARAKVPAATRPAPLAEGALVPAGTAATRGGAPFATQPVDYDAVLLLGFGGPEGQDDVIPFLRNVTAGRGIPDERLEEVAHHYRHFGGVSPINDHNRALRAALQAELDGRGHRLPVYWGNRNWAPYVDEALQRAFDDGHRSILAIATSAYSSYSSCRQYREDLADALEATGLPLEIDKVREFFDHPGFVTPFVDGLRAGIAQLAERGIDVADAEILFSTHSIPNVDADRSGAPEDGFGPGGAYLAQHLAVAEQIMAQLGDRCPWQLVFQSRSGPAHVPWLEPDINDAMQDLPARGRKAVLIVPLGFVSDHMEVMWDLDTEALQTAADLGLAAVRTATPGLHPAFVAGLADLVEERLQGTPPERRPHLTALGPAYDVCRPGCCENTHRGFRPALAGVIP